MDTFHPKILTRLMTRGMAPGHPGYAAAADREVRRLEERRREDRVRALWGWLAPRQPFPSPNFRGVVQLGQWPAAEFHALARNLPGLGALAERTAEQVVLTWAEGDKDVLVVSQSPRGNREARYRL